MQTALTFRGKNQELLDVAVPILRRERPMTLRQLYYRVVSAGALANNQKEYKRLGNLMTRLREAGELPRTWIVDHVRDTLKPPSWSGLADFGDTMREAYRKDFWASLDHHVEVFVEKDAIAGTIQPVTQKYDIALHVCRGYSSVSFAGEIADLWAQIEKPIYAYYLGDFDPSGFDLERDLRAKLERYSGKYCFCPGNAGVAEHEFAGWALQGDAGGQTVFWDRLAIRQSGFEDFNLIALPVKHTDRRSAKFTKRHGSDCAEVDALPPTELRRRVSVSIMDHIDQQRWERLLEVEKMEQETLATMMKAWRDKKVDLG